ncbi:MAG TPA: cupin domain-containing protein [Dehalococcoidia bacterium]|nr:cupin domain-containing protein [Dehalococcoidia bacterium]
MRIITSGSDLKPANQPIFDREGVFTQPLVTEQDVKIQRLTLVRFTKGARTRLHTHTYDQVLMATEGRGLVSVDGHEHELNAGQIIVIPSGTPHWHGAKDESPFAHINIATPGETQIIE